MGTTINGNNVLVPGQVSVLTAPTSLNHVVTNRYLSRTKCFVANLNLDDAAPVDLSTLTVNSTKYIPVAAYVFDPSANLSAATLGIYSGPGASGVAIVTPVLLAALTGAGTFQELTIAALASVVTSGTLYPRLTVAAGTPGTATLILEYIDLSLI